MSIFSSPARVRSSVLDGLWAVEIAELWRGDYVLATHPRSGTSVRPGAPT